MTEDKDARITRLLGLLEQAKEFVEMVANAGHPEMGRTIYANIVLAKIEKEKAK